MFLVKVKSYCCLLHGNVTNHSGDRLGSNIIISVHSAEYLLATLRWLLMIKMEI